MKDHTYKIHFVGLPFEDRRGGSIRMLQRYTTSTILLLVQYCT